MKNLYPSTTVVIARYREDLEWLQRLPESIQVIVYNKGAAVASERVLDRIDHLEPRRNFGREAETYLHHIRSHRDSLNPDGFTVFCQGDPFPHSPDFLKLLDHRDDWVDIQPLTDQWLTSRSVPPAAILDGERDEWLGGASVRTDLYSLHHLVAVRYHDDGAARIGSDYLTGHGLPAGSQIIGHFLEAAGWDELAAEARAADFGQFCFGAMFAVRNPLLSRIPTEVLHRFQRMSRAHAIYAYLFERLWLHFFGLPFHPALLRHPMPRRSPLPA